MQPLEKIPNFYYSETQIIINYIDDKIDRYPQGSIAIAIQGNLWITKIPADSETIPLFRNLLSKLMIDNEQHFTYNGYFSLVDRVKYCLAQIVSCSDIIIDKAKWNRDDNGNIIGFSFNKRVTGKGTNEVRKETSKVCGYLKKYIHRLTQEQFNQAIEKGSIEQVTKDVFIVTTSNKDKVIYFKFVRRFYFTNLLATEENIKVVLSTVEGLHVIRNSCNQNLPMRFVCLAMMNNLASIVRRVVSIRPAYLATIKGSEDIAVVHRPFTVIRSRQELYDQSELMALAVELLNLKELTCRDRGV